MNRDVRLIIEGQVLEREESWVREPGRSAMMEGAIGEGAKSKGARRAFHLKDQSFSALMVSLLSTSSSSLAHIVWQERLSLLVNRCPSH